MNELGLPPHGREPAFAADEKAYAAVVGRALTRRRVRALATTSAGSVAAVAVVVALSGSAAGGRAIVEPAAPAGPATSPGAPAPGASPSSPAPSRSYPPDIVVGSLDPDTMFVYPYSTDGPPLPPVEEPTTGPRNQPGPVWGESVANVDDRSDVACDTSQPTDAWCYRFLGPKTILAGEETTFVAELCRRPGSGENRVELSHDHELSVMLVRDGNLVADSPTGPERPHMRIVGNGNCLRWSKTWNGIGNHGEKPASGTYEVFVAVSGYTPHKPVPGTGLQQDRTSYLYRGPVEVVS